MKYSGLESGKIQFYGGNIYLPFKNQNGTITDQMYIAMSGDSSVLKDTMIILH